MRVTDYLHSGVRPFEQDLVRTAAQPLNHEIDHWCVIHSIPVIIRCKQNKEVGTVFDDFRAFQTAFKAFQDETNQLFVVKKSKSVDAVNKKLDAKSTKYKPDLRGSFDK